MVKIIDTEVKETVYTVELTQKEVDTIHALVGKVLGGGEVREVTRDLFHTFDELSVTSAMDLFVHVTASTREGFTFG